MLLVGTSEGIIEFDEPALGARRRLWRTPPIVALATRGNTPLAATAAGEIWQRGHLGWRRYLTPPLAAEMPTALAIAGDGALWLGTTPACLWRAHDRSWSRITALSDHASTHHWWGLDDASAPRVVAISPDPRDPASLVVAIAVGGIYHTMDGGATWQAMHDGISPLCPPGPQTAVAHRDVVALQRHPHFFNISYAATESAIYRIEFLNGEGHWRDITPQVATPLPLCPQALIPIPRERGGALALMAPRAEAEQMSLWRTFDAGSNWESGSDLPLIQRPSVDQLARCQLLLAPWSPDITLLMLHGTIWLKDARTNWSILASDLGQLTSALWLVS